MPIVGSNGSRGGEFPHPKIYASISATSRAITQRIHHGLTQGGTATAANTNPAHTTAKTTPLAYSSWREFAADPQHPPNPHQPKRAANQSGYPIRSASGTVQSKCKAATLKLDGFLARTVMSVKIHRARGTPIGRCIHVRCCRTIPTGRSTR